MRLDKRVAYGLALLLTLGTTASAQESSITVKILDKRKAPVPGTVILNPGNQPLGKTPPSGEHKFSHKCAVGQTLKAVPDDRGKYYNSEEQVCGIVVVLEVFPRPQEVFSSNDIQLFWTVEGPAAQSPYKGKIYAGLFGGVSDKVEPIAGGRNGRCRVSLDKKFGIGVYSPQTNTWKKIEDPAVKIGGPSNDPVYMFETNCEDAQPQIAELKRQAVSEVEATAANLSASPAIRNVLAKQMER